MSNDSLITDEIRATLERDDRIPILRRWPSQSDMAR